MTHKSIFDQAAFEGYQQTWLGRRQRYELYRAYYYGRAYDNLRTFALTQGLYRGTRTLFSPLRKAVRVDVSKVPAGWALPKEASQQTIDRVKEMRKLADVERVYQQFTRFGAVAGESAMVLAGSLADGFSVSAHHADDVVQGKLDDGTPFALIVKRQTVTGLPYNGQLYSYRGTINEYAMLITPEKVITYKDGEPYSYEPGRKPEQVNVFGFIPLVFGCYSDDEDGSGAPAFAGVLELLDKVNEMASMTLDVIGRNAEPLLVGTGVTDIERDPENDALLTPQKDAKFYTVEPNLAIADTLAFIQDVRDEFKSLLPQLAIDELRNASDLAYDTVMMLLQEVGDHIVSVRTCVDRSVETIEQWMLGQDEGGVPEDYEIDRDRRWLALTESQQLDLEVKRLGLESQRQGIEAQRQSLAQQQQAAAQSDQTHPIDLESKVVDLEAKKKALTEKPAPGATAK